MHFEFPRLIRSLRICLAMLIAEILTNYFKLDNSVWILITITVILFDQATVGGTLYRSILRFIATISGVIVALAAVFVFNNNYVMNIVVGIIATFIYSYLFMDKKNSYIGVLGVVTVFMMLSYSDQINAGMYRFANIALGIIIAVSVSLLFFPQSATQTTTNLLFEAINKIKNTLNMLVNQTEDNYKILQNHFIELEYGIISEVTKFNRHLDDIRFEGKKNSSKIKQYKEALLYIRRIYRVLNILFQTKSYFYIRHHEEIKQQINELIKILGQITPNLVLPENNSHIIHHINYPKFDTCNTESTYESIFIYKSVNTLIDEINNLIQTF